MQTPTTDTPTAKKLSPFEIADSIFMKTAKLDPETCGFDSFMMNRIASNNLDTVFFAEEMNRRPGLSKAMVYSFYFNALDKGKRYGKWHKNAAADKKAEEIACVAAAYGVNRTRAAQYHTILGPAGVKAVIASQEKGGKGATRGKPKTV